MRIHRLKVIAIARSFLYSCIPILLTACIPFETSEATVSTPVTATKAFIQNTPTQGYQGELEHIPTSETASSDEPTLTTEQTRGKVLELLKNNKGCFLPCFWGMTPGKTKWSETKEFLRSLASQYSEDAEAVTNEFFYSDLYFPALDIQGQWDLKLELGVHKDTISTISVSDFDMPNYWLEEFLLENGKPDEIWVYTNSQGSITSPDKVGFVVSLFYQEKQMIAAYGRGSAAIDDAWINGCVQYSPALKIWSLDEPLTFPEAASFFYNYDVIQEGWKKISEATQGEFDVERFYQTFVDSSIEPCFRTPKNLWFPL